MKINMSTKHEVLGSLERSENASNDKDYGIAHSITSKAIKLKILVSRSMPLDLVKCSCCEKIVPTATMELHTVAP